MAEGLLAVVVVVVRVREAIWEGILRLVGKGENFWEWMRDDCGGGLRREERERDMVSRGRLLLVVVVLLVSSSLEDSRVLALESISEEGGRIR